jgi:uncharacterized protein
MQIQLEAHETHTIMGYSDTEIKINQQTYCDHLILSSDHLITPWDIQGDFLKPLFELNPDVILLGTHTPDILRQAICKQPTHQSIGIECMTIGAACRTFNLLLSEQRHVVAGFILNR